MIYFALPALLLELFLTSPPSFGLELKSVSLSAAKDPSLNILQSPRSETLSGAEFVKLSIVFEKDEALSKIAIESCDRPFKDGVEFFYSPGFRSSYAEAGKKTLSAVVSRASEKVRTVAIVFGNNDDVCFSSIKVWNDKGMPIQMTASAALSAPTAKELGSTEVLKDILDREYTNRENGEQWRYRFRSDGSFFIRGYADDMNGSRAFSALGKFKVASAAKKSVKLELEGFRYGTPDPWDGVICSSECGVEEISNAPVKETLEIERTKAGAVFIRNRSDRNTRTLPFSDLKVRPSSLTE